MGKRLGGLDWLTLRDRYLKRVRAPNVTDCSLKEDSDRVSQAHLHCNGWPVSPTLVEPGHTCTPASDTHKTNMPQKGACRSEVVDGNSTQSDNSVHIKHTEHQVGKFQTVIKRPLKVQPTSAVLNTIVMV